MDFNGNTGFRGIGTPELSDVAAASSTGEDGENKKGVLKFPNGFKIQWDTASIVTDTETTVTLPSAYTEAQYGVIGSIATDLSDSLAAAGVQISIGDNPLSEINVFQNATGTNDVAYISWGKDAI